VNNIIKHNIFKDLSDPDRKFLGATVARELCDQFEPIVVSNTTFKSANEFLLDMTESLAYEKYQRSLSKRRSASSSKIGLSDGKQSVTTTAALESLESAILSEPPVEKPVLVVVSFAEFILPHIFGDVMSILRLSSCQFHILMIHSAADPVTCLLSDAVQGLEKSCSILHSFTSLQLYDEVMGSVLIAKEIPIWFTAAAVAWIQEGFWRCNCCVKSAVDRQAHL
jgi:hypothetical protein